MKQREITIKSRTGLHARPASDFVQKAHTFKSDIKLVKGEIEANGKSIMSVLTLGATFNTKILLIIEGEDEDIAIDVLSKILEEE